jgi:hypothetical protein
MRSTKFKSLVHYICARRNDNPTSLGAVKLNKILWLSDLSSFYENGSAITESRYIKREFGPVPARIMPVLKELEKEGVLSVRDTHIYDKQKKEYVVYAANNGAFMRPEEKAIVDRVIDHVCDEHTAASVSEATHDHIWRAAEPGEELPLFTVFARPGVITESEREWAQLQLETVAE